MKRTTDMILVTVISALGICAVAVPAINNHNNEFTSVAPVRVENAHVETNNKLPEDEPATVSEYDGKVTSFRTTRMIATQGGILENWLKAPGQSVFELDRIAVISTSNPERDETMIATDNKQPASISPARIFDSVQRSNERLHESIHSTASGTFTSTGINAGDSVHQGKTIALIVDGQYSIIKFEVSHIDFGRMRNMMGVELHSPEYPSERLIGRIISKTNPGEKNNIEVEVLNLTNYVLHPGTNVKALFRF